MATVWYALVLDGNSEDSKPVLRVQNDMLDQFVPLHVEEKGQAISDEVEDLVGLFNSISLDFSTVFNEKRQLKLLLGVWDFMLLM